MNVRALTLLPFSLTVGCMVENSISAVGRGHLEADSGYEIDVDTETEQETEEEPTEENDYEEPVEEEGTDTLPTEEEEDEIEFETEPAPENDCTETSDLIYTVDRTLRRCSSSILSMLLSFIGHVTCAIGDGKAIQVQWEFLVMAPMFVIQVEHYTKLI